MQCCEQNAIMSTGGKCLCQDQRVARICCQTSLSDKPDFSNSNARRRRSDKRSALPLGLGTGICLLCHYCIIDAPLYNVRKPKESSKPYRKMIETVEKNPRAFHVKYRGITFICSGFDITPNNSGVRQLNIQLEKGSHPNSVIGVEALQCQRDRG